MYFYVDPCVLCSLLFGVSFVMAILRPPPAYFPANALLTAAIIVFPGY